MMKTKCLIFFLLFTAMSRAQDTFSIVAVDTVTGEVGSAGASCLDLFAFGFPVDDFISELFPGVGGINTQASYLTANQQTARNRMNAGDSPQQIIDYLVANDAQGNATVRQYGVVRLNNGSSSSVAFTGSNCLALAGHRTGATYSIQGNILISEDVLDDMEYQFLNTEGDLKCKLMAALQGAKRVGADSRCQTDGTSSLFSFIKVSQPTDAFGAPSFMLSVRTHDNSGIEPVDSLQVLFDQQVSGCTFLALDENNEQLHYSIYPIPANDVITLESTDATIEQQYSIRSIEGVVVLEGTFSKSCTVSTEQLSSGMYVVQIKRGSVVHNRTISIVK